jgi:LSD1 subclass zinc finger protein
MMTPAEFVKKLRACKTQQALVVLGIIVVSTLAVTAAFIHITGFVRVIFVVCWIVLMLFVGQFVSAFLSRKQGLVCSSCRRPLETIRIVETGKCPHCQTQVIHDA